MQDPSMNKSGAKKKGNRLITALVLGAIFLSFLAEEVPGLIPVLVCLGIAVAIALAAVRMARKRSAGDGSIAGDAAAGHLCESHNGVPSGKRARKHTEAGETHSARSEYERKAEGINDLYAAGIIGAAERAERLAALR